MSSRHFTDKERSCRCGCGFMIRNQAFIDRLDALRDDVGQPLVLNSAARCPAYNKKIGGSRNSAHALPDPVAADIRCRSSRLRYKIVGAAYRVGFRRIEWGTRTWIHVDMATEETGHHQDVLFPPD